MRRFFIGLCAGIGFGYLSARTVQAGADLRDPRAPLKPDPRAYGRLRRGLMIAGLVHSAAVTGWIAFAVAPRVDRGRRVARPRRIALIACALAANAVLETPPAYVEDYVVERRFQLSDRALEDWLIERGKAGAASIGVVTVLVEMLATIMERAPGRWPWYATAAAPPLLIATNLIVPLFVAPLFNKFSPIDGALEERLRALARAFGVGDADILRVDMSRQTRKANAYVTGLFRTHRIVVGDTLIEKFPIEQIEFVVAHELGHFVSRDTWRFVVAGTAGAGLTFFAGARLAARSNVAPASITGLARFFFFATIVSLLLTPAIAAFSRSRERAADRFALKATGDANSGALAFERLRDQNLAEGTPPKWMELLFSTHPSLDSRIARLRASA